MFALILLRFSMLYLAFNGSSSSAQSIQPYLATDAQSLLQGVPPAPHFLQQQPQQFQQTDQQEASLPTQMMPMQGTASLPMQDVMSLMQSVQGLQNKEKSLERQLVEARAEETQLNGNALSATYRSNLFEQRAQKLAQLAQTSANQAQESLNQLSDVKRRLVDSEREKQELAREKEDSEREKQELAREKEELAKELSLVQKADEKSERQIETMSKRYAESEGKKQALTKQLSQTQAFVKNLQSVVASTQRKQHDALHAQQISEQQTREAEAREKGALDAAEKEDKAIEQEEAMLNKLKVHEDGALQMRALDASGMIQNVKAEEESSGGLRDEMIAGKAHGVLDAFDLSPSAVAGRGRIGEHALIPKRPRLRGGLSAAAFRKFENSEQ